MKLLTALLAYCGLASATVTLPIEVICGTSGGTNATQTATFTLPTITGTTFWIQMDLFNLSYQFTPVFTKTANISGSTLTITGGTTGTITIGMFATFPGSAPNTKVTGVSGSTITVSHPQGASQSGQTSGLINFWTSNPEGSISFNGNTAVNMVDANVTLNSNAATSGGIGGFYSVITVTMPITSTQLVSNGSNTFTWKVLGTDTNSAGYRVLNFNVIQGGSINTSTGLVTGGTPLLVQPGYPGSQFVATDPSTFACVPGFCSGSDISAGKTTFQTATLTQPTVNYAGTISLTAHCGDCHSADGYDLAYFNYSNQSIIERSLFHGLTTTQSNQIASYIRTLGYHIPANARPWNPLYQPGPGLDQGDVRDWAASGAGFYGIPTDTVATNFVNPTGTAADLKITNFTSMRNQPVPIPQLDWNHWLPRTYPGDSSALATLFNASNIESGIASCQSEMNQASQSAATAAYIADSCNMYGALTTNTYNFSIANKPVSGDSRYWVSSYTSDWYSVFLYTEVKMWELMHKNGWNVEDKLQSFFGSTTRVPPRGWPTALVFGTSPSISKTTPGAPGIHNGTFETFLGVSYQWYSAQVVLNYANECALSGAPIDYAYYQGFIDHANSIVPGQASLIVGLHTNALQLMNGWTMTGSGCTVPWDYSKLDPIFETFSTGTLGTIPSGQATNLVNSFLQNYLWQVDHFTPAQWRAAYGSNPGACCSASDQVTAGLAFQGLADDIAYAIPRYKHYGLNQELLAYFVTWADSMWPTACAGFTGSCSGVYNWWGLLNASVSCTAGAFYSTLSCTTDSQVNGPATPTSSTTTAVIICDPSPTGCTTQTNPIVKPSGTLNLYALPFATPGGNGQGGTTTWSVTSGPGTVNSSGVYTAPSSQTNTAPAVVHAVNGARTADFTLYVQGTQYSF